MPDPKNGAVASGRHLARATVGSLGRRIRRAAFDIDRHLGGSVRRLAIFLPKWLEQRAQRRSLRSLSDHMLKDIGLSRCDVEREARARWSDK